MAFTTKLNFESITDETSPLNIKRLNENFWKIKNYFVNAADLIVTKTLITTNLYAEYGDITELTVDVLKTANKVERYWANNTNDLNYIWAEEQELKYITGTVKFTDSVADTVQHTDRNGNKLYYNTTTGVTSTTYKEVGMTITETSFPVMVYAYTEITKGLETFYDSGGIYVRKSVYGAGTGTGDNDKLFIYKPQDKGIIEYIDDSGNSVSINLKSGLVQGIGNTGAGKSFRNILISTTPPTTDNQFGDMAIDTDETFAEIPTGGTIGQVLKKLSGDDYDVGWGDGGGSGSTVSVNVGTTTTGDAGTNASVTNSGTDTAVVLDFVIPRGATGATGAKGDKGDTGDTGATGADGLTVSVNNVTQVDGNITIDTDDISEGSTNQYFTAAKVRDVVLTGLSTATNAVITATDTVLTALGKLQKQISDNLSALTSHTSNTSNPHSVTYSQTGAAASSHTHTSSDVSNFASAALSAAPAETTTSIGTLINSATAKPTPVDADMVALMDSAASNVAKKLSWANILTGIRGTLLTGLSTSTNSVISATDTILTAIGKLQAQINGRTIDGGYFGDSTSNTYDGGTW